MLIKNFVIYLIIIFLKKKTRVRCHHLSFQANEIHLNQLYILPFVDSVRLIPQPNFTQEFYLRLIFLSIFIFVC